MNKEQAEEQFAGELASLYQNLSDGLDVSPARRLRLEGRVELMLEMQLLSWSQLEKTVTRLYKQYFRQSLPDNYWQWLANEKTVCLPFKMQDAPVYKN